MIHGRNGIDCGAKIGTPIYAAADGVVKAAIASGYNAGYGKYVVIVHPSNDTETLYAHMSKLYVKAGQQVAQGEHIGDIGNTGRSSGPHVHFEIHNAQNVLGNYRLKASVVAGN